MINFDKNMVRYCEVCPFLKVNKLQFKYMRENAQRQEKEAYVFMGLLLTGALQ